MNQINEVKSDSPLSRLHQIFIPSTPVLDKKQCYGRFQEINRITKALREPGKHVLLFGGRGYGKTSVANIVHHNLNEFFTVKINCHRSLNTFSSIWKDIFNEVVSSLTYGNRDKSLNLNLEKYFSEWEVIEKRPTLGIIDVIGFFKRVDFPLLIIIDEADLIAQEAKNLGIFADTIKALSDQLPLVKLLIIGIANNSSDFIGEHTSLERCLVEVNLVRMEEQGLMDIIDGGLLKIKMEATPEVKKNIVLFACGLPYYVHLITLYAVEMAQELNYKILVEKNFQNAVLRALGNMEENLNRIFHTAIGRSSAYSDIINASMVLEENAMAEEFYLSRQEPQHHTDFGELGFTAEETSSFLIKKKRLEMGESKVTRYLNTLSEPTKGSILQKIRGSQGIRYRFTSPLFRAYLHYRMYNKLETPKPAFFVS